MTDLATAAAPPAPVADRPPRGGSLLRAEIHRFRSRRFIQVVLVLALVGYALVIALASATGFGKTTPEQLLTDNAVALVLTGGNRLFIFGEGFVDGQGNFVDSGREVLLTNLHGGLVLGVATSVLVAVGVVLFQRRDLH